VQLLNLLEVVMVNAENEINQTKLDASSEKPSGPENAVQNAQDDTNVSGSSLSKSNAEDNSKTPAVDNESNMQVVLQNLPQAELRLLCSLLAHDGYGLWWFDLMISFTSGWFMIATVPFYFHAESCNYENLPLAFTLFFSVEKPGNCILYWIVFCQFFVS
jgi:E3 ubiquitin-protein ligase HUWE1